MKVRLGGSLGEDGLAAEVGGLGEVGHAAEVGGLGEVGLAADVGGLGEVGLAAEIGDLAEAGLLEGVPDDVDLLLEMWIVRLLGVEWSSCLQRPHLYTRVGGLIAFRTGLITFRTELDQCTDPATASDRPWRL